MQNKGFVTIIITVLVVAIAGVAGYFVLVKPAQPPKEEQVPPTTTPPPISTESQTPGIPVLSILTPTKGERLVAGSVYRIRWNTNNFPGNAKINIQITRDSIGPAPFGLKETFVNTAYADDRFGPFLSLIIVKDYPPNKGFYDWTIPADFRKKVLGSGQQGNQYYLNITYSQLISSKGFTETGPFIVEQLEADIINYMKENWQQVLGVLEFDKMRGGLGPKVFQFIGNDYVLVKVEDHSNEVASLLRFDGAQFRKVKSQIIGTSYFGEKEYQEMLKTYGDPNYQLNTYGTYPGFLKLSSNKFFE